MTKSYLHVKDYEKELNELKKEGFTEKQIGEKLGLSFKQVHNFFYRQRVNQRKLNAGISLKKKGRPPKDYVVTEDMKIQELKYIIARKDSKIKTLEMQNELMRDFLLLTGRK